MNHTHDTYHPHVNHEQVPDPVSQHAGGIALAESMTAPSTRNYGI